MVSANTRQKQRDFQRGSVSSMSLPVNLNPVFLSVYPITAKRPKLYLKNTTQSGQTGLYWTTTLHSYLTCDLFVDNNMSLQGYHSWSEAPEWPCFALSEYFQVVHDNILLQSIIIFYCVCSLPHDNLPLSWYSTCHDQQNAHEGCLGVKGTIKAVWRDAGGKREISPVKRRPWDSSGGW